jgi:hypothetical protein
VTTFILVIKKEHQTIRKDPLTTRDYEIARWANGFIGKPMKPWGQGEEHRSPVFTWVLGQRGRGVWFKLENGQVVYRPVPKKLRR